MSHEPPADRLEPPAANSAGTVPAPGFALLTAVGYALATTDVFTRLVGLGALSAPEVTAAIAELTVGRAEVVTLQVPLTDGGAAPARLEAVNDAHERLILLEVALPRPADDLDEITSWFGRFVEDSEAIIWLKDLEGRYLYVNGAYCQQLGVEAERIRGLTDADLSQTQAIDGLRNRRVDGPEPVQLEYVIPAFDRRPAYTARRFPLNDASGATLAVCGVASPADQAEIANAECDRLLEVIQWLDGDPAALRRLVLSDWGITATQSHLGPVSAPTQPVAAAASPQPPPGSPPAPAGPAQMPTELSALLQSLQRQVSELESRVGSSAAPAPTEIELLEAELAQLRRQLTAERARAEAAEAALAAAREQITRLERAPATAVTAGPIAPPRPGWDGTAQMALAEGLKGCVDLRSILSEAVSLIGGAGGWDVVVGWLADDQDGRFGAAATWVRSRADMAALETSMWQAHQSPSASAVGSTAASGELAWFHDLGQTGDQHLAHLGDHGMATVVLLPISQAGPSVAVLELATAARAERGAAEDAALRSIEAEIAAAHQRATGTPGATRWGRRSG